MNVGVHISFQISGFFLWKNVNNIWIRGSEDYTIPKNAFNVVYKLKEERKKHIKSFGAKFLK